MPWRESKGLVYGPGVFDMKGGIVQTMFALRALRETGQLQRPLTVLLVSDEEEGSDSSRAHHREAGRPLRGRTGVRARRPWWSAEDRPQRGG